MKSSPQKKVENNTNLTFVGLWNPQKQYNKTRHNIGAECIFRFCDKNNINMKPHKSGKFQIGTYELEDSLIDLVVPMVSMNNSGEALREYMINKNITLEDIVVIHDDIDLAFGRLRLKIGSSDGGHNGIRSINKAIGSKDYFRLRLGVGRPPIGIDPAEFVLSIFKSDEIDEVNFLVEDTIDIVKVFHKDRELAIKQASERRIIDIV